jgi:acetyltransferase
MTPEAIPFEYPAQHEARVALKDGSKLLLRPIRPSDAPLLIDLFNKLSPRSIYMRFLSPLRQLPEGWARRLATVDYVKDFALVGVIEEGPGEALVAVGRYASDPEKGRAELAVVVRDDWQGRGLGRLVLARVIEIARGNGIRRFDAVVDHENSIVMGIIDQLGYPHRVRTEQGAYYVEIEAQ